MRLLPAIFVLLLCAQHSHAECDCLWGGSFSDVQAGTDLVVSGRVVAAAGNSIDLRISRLLRGEVHRETIRVWLKAADYCRPEAALFPLDSDWVMALHRITSEIPGGFNPGTPNVSYGRVGDYSLSSCGGYWLRNQGNRVTGNLVDGPRWDYQPPMTPVLLDLVADHVQGNLDRASLKEASEVDPRLRELMLDTRSFIRNEN
ncbi:MAG: delta-aminolevulinic acid dehydratase [Halioglobus sp.]|nr:delta-aminolevulinic acid dehydratase [Halioglobus sp.]